MQKKKLPKKEKGQGKHTYNGSYRRGKERRQETGKENWKQEVGKTEKKMGYDGDSCKLKMTNSYMMMTHPSHIIVTPMVVRSTRI